MDEIDLGEATFIALCFVFRNGKYVKYMLNVIYMNLNYLFRTTY